VTESLTHTLDTTYRSISFSIRTVLPRKLHNALAFLLSRVYLKSIVHVIGDGHVYALEKNRFFIIHHIGPATAHNLISESSTTQSKQKLFEIIDKMNKKRDVALLVFGEIDCRIHIFYQYMKRGQAESISTIIAETISNYGETLKLLENEGISFFVFGIPPPGTIKNIYNYPFYADKETRVRIYAEFNSALKKFCLDNNYRYLDIQSKFADRSGFMSKNFASDDVHLNHKAGLIIGEELKMKAGSLNKKSI
jgi:hypothetical protein